MLPEESEAAVACMYMVPLARSLISLVPLMYYTLLLRKTKVSKRLAEGGLEHGPRTLYAVQLALATVSILFHGALKPTIS